MAFFEGGDDVGAIWVVGQYAGGYVGGLGWGEGKWVLFWTSSVCRWGCIVSRGSVGAFCVGIECVWAVDVVVLLGGVNAVRNCCDGVARATRESQVSERDEHYFSSTRGIAQGHNASTTLHGKYLLRGIRQIRLYLLTRTNPPRRLKGGFNQFFARSPRI